MSSSDRGDDKKGDNNELQTRINRVYIEPLRQFEVAFPTDGPSPTENYKTARLKIAAARNQIATITRNAKFEEKQIHSILEKLERELGIKNPNNPDGLLTNRKEQYISDAVRLIRENSRPASSQALAVFLKQTIDLNNNKDKKKMLNIYAEHKSFLTFQKEANLTVGSKGTGATLKEIIKTLDAASKLSDEKESRAKLLSLLDGKEFKKKLGEIVEIINKKHPGAKITIENLNSNHLQDLLTDPRYQFFVLLYQELNKMSKNDHLSADNIYHQLETQFKKIKLGTDSNDPDIYIKGYQIDMSPHFVIEGREVSMQIPDYETVRAQVDATQRASLRH